MHVILEDGYVASYAIIGTLPNSIEVEAPEDFVQFEKYYSAYTIKENKLVLSLDKKEELTAEQKKQELRDMRQLECFSVIDRSKLWYDTLTDSQLQELRTWYDLWLKVTDTLTIPEKPTWLQ